MNFSVARLVRTALIAAGVSLAGVGSAQGALWTGAWDPRYGTPFDGNFDPDVLGWRGIATFDIPETCIVGNTAISTCAGMSLVSAQVTFYDFQTDATVETFNYAPGDLDGFSATFDSGGVLRSLVTEGFFAPRSPVSNFSVINLYTFSLQFVEEGVRMYHTKDYDILGFPVGPYSAEKCDKNWLLRVSQPWVCGYSGTYSDGTEPAPVVLVSFSKVPEPGSIALLFAAGLAGLLLRFGRPAARLKR